MSPGAIMGQIDVAQVTLFAFWLFFFGLIFYLRREDRREGYPLEEDTTGKLENPGAIWMADPKTFKLPHGGEAHAPSTRRDADRGPLAMKRTAVWPGAPYEPTGDGMKDGVGPASYALRSDTPDLTLEGKPKIRPMRNAGDFSIAREDSDIRGFDVIAGDGKKAGKVADLWVDTGEQLIRYIEVQTASGKNVLAPMTLTQVRGGRKFVLVKSIMSDQFDDVPAQKNPDEVTLLEEDKISAYYCGGILMATPKRSEPLL